MSNRSELVDFTGTHVTHCCAAHGCKYGEDNTCPVVLRTHKQQYPCEECGSNNPEYSDDPDRASLIPTHGYYDRDIVWHPAGEARNSKYEYVTRLMPFEAIGDDAGLATDRELAAHGYKRVWADVATEGVFAVYRRERGG